MDIQNLIRSGIFLTAAVLLLLFPKQIYKMQDKVMSYLIKTFHLNFIHYNEKQVMRTNKISSIAFIIISIILFIYSVSN